MWESLFFECATVFGLLVYSFGHFSRSLHWLLTISLFLSNAQPTVWSHLTTQKITRLFLFSCICVRLYAVKSGNYFNCVWFYLHWKIRSCNNSISTLQWLAFGLEQSSETFIATQLVSDLRKHIITLSFWYSC